MYLGSSAESPSARRSFPMTTLILWSNSTTVSLGQKLLLDFLASDELAAALDQHLQDLEGLVLQ